MVEQVKDEQNKQVAPYRETFVGGKSILTPILVTNFIA